MFKISPVQQGVLENFRKHQYLYPIQGSEGWRQAPLQTVWRSCKNKGERAKFGWKLNLKILEVLMILRFYKRMGQDLFLFRADHTTR